MVGPAAGGPLSTEGLVTIGTREEYLARLKAAKAAAGISLTQVPGMNKAKVERLLTGTINTERLTLFLTACGVPGPEQWHWAKAWARLTGTAMAPPARGARRLEDWPTKLLGIHDAIDRRWPTYVHREIDDELQKNLREAASAGGFIVLYGGSCSGKSRSLYQAACRELPGWWLVRPIKSEIAELAPGEHTIVWLDEIQHLLDEPNVLEPASIVRLLDPANPVVVLGTIPRGRFNDLTVPSGTRAALILDLAVTMEIADQFTAAEQESAETVGRHDETVAEALRVPGFGLTQTLAAAPELINHWRKADEYAKSVILAAVEARRLGVQGPLTAAYLEAAAPGYWDDSVRDRATGDWFGAAFDFGRAVIRGATAVLPEVAGEEIGSRLGWTVADYLLQTLARQLRTTSVRASTWRAIADEVADPQDLFRAGVGAEQRLLYAEAETLYRRTGTASGVRRLTAMHVSRGYGERVLPTLSAAVDAGLPVAMQLANALMARDRLDEAVPFFKLAAEQGSPSARRRLATLLSGAGRLDDALVQWRQVYALEGRPDGRHGVADTLVALGRSDEAAAFLAATAPADEPRPVVETRSDPDDLAVEHAEALSKQGRLDEAVAYLRRRIDELDPAQAEQNLRWRDMFRWSLLRILRDHGDLRDQADVLQAMILETPNSDALAVLCRVLCALGESDELRRMVDQGVPYAPQALAECLREHDYDGLQQRARDGDRPALRVLTQDLIAERREADAIVLWQVACETTSDRKQLADLLQAVGRRDEAVMLLREAAESESGNVYDMRALVDLLTALALVDDLIPLAARGISAAEKALAAIMAVTDPQSELMRHLILTGRGSAAYHLHSPAESDLTGPAARLLRLGLTAEGELETES